jgi:hypothetical protein
MPVILMAQASRSLRIPLAPFPGRAAAGSAIDKGAIEGALRGSLSVCNCAIRRTFFLRPAPTPPRRGGPRVVRRLLTVVVGATASRANFCRDTVCVVNQSAQRCNDAPSNFANRLPASSRFAIAHATNIGESDAREIVKERQKSD